MAFNGSGTFNRTNGVNSGVSLWTADKNGGTKIVANRHDTHDQDIATGLSNCICKDGQTTITANIPFNNKSATGIDGVASDTGRDFTVEASGAADISLKTNGTNRFTVRDSDASLVAASGSKMVFDAAVINAAGSVQADATSIVNQFTTVDLADGTNGVILPEDVTGGLWIVHNHHSTQSLNLYPALGDQINKLGTNTPAVLAPEETAILYKVSANRVYGGAMLKF